MDRINVLFVVPNHFFLIGFENKLIKYIVRFEFPQIIKRLKFLHTELTNLRGRHNKIRRM